MGVLCCVTFHLLCKLSDYTLGTSFSPALTMGMPAVGLVSLRCCFHQATSTDPLKSAARLQ